MDDNNVSNKIDESVDPKLRQFLEALFPICEHEFIELRFIAPGKSPITRFYGSVEGLLSCQSEIKTLGASYNVYFGVCPRNKRKGDKSAVTRCHALWVDVDFKDIPRADADAIITGFTPAPNIIVSSGHGYHMYWLIDAYLLDSNETKSNFETILKGLACVLQGDTAVAELARVLRLPGTNNLKYPDAVEKVEIIRLDIGHRYHIDDFHKYVSAQPVQPLIENVPINTNNASLNGLNISEKIRSLILNGWDGSSYKSRSEADEAVIVGLLRAGVSDEDIYSIFHNPAYGISKKSFEKGNYGQAYLTASVENGKKYLEQERTEEIEVDAFARPISDLLNSPDQQIDYLVEPLVCSGSLGFIGGEPKVTKSWFGLHIGLAVSTASKVLGNFTVPKRRKVLYLQEEDSVAMVKKRVSQLVAGCGMPVPEDAYFHHVIRSGFKIDNSGWVERLRKELSLFRPELFIVDVFNRVHLQDENDQRGMTNVMNSFDSLRREFGCAIIIVHHFRKHTMGSSSRGQQRLRGSSVLAGYAENSMYLTTCATGVFRVELESKMAQLEHPFGYVLEITENDGVSLSYRDNVTSGAQDKNIQLLLASVEENYRAYGKERCTINALCIATKLADNSVRKYAASLESTSKLKRGVVKLGGKGAKVLCYIPVDAKD
jgi:hypothetical protein